MPPPRRFTGADFHIDYQTRAARPCRSAGRPTFGRSSVASATTCQLRAQLSGRCYDCYCRVLRLGWLASSNLRYLRGPEPNRREGFALAPFAVIGCTGFFRRNGTILRGSQNGFNLAEYVAIRLPRVHDGQTQVVTQNDAVVQGLSEWAWMRRLKHWGVLTIGTGLGNARFTNR